MSSGAETSPLRPVLALTLGVVVACLALFGLLHEDPGGHWAAYPGPGSSLDQGLVGYWKFDDSASVVDSSGNGNDGVFVNSDLEPGRYGQAVALKGGDDSHVSIPATANLDEFTDQITVSAWVFPNARPDGFRVVASRQIGMLLHPDQFYLGYGTALGLELYKWHLGTIDDDGTVNDDSVYAGLVTANRWVHMVGVYDGTIMRLYVNGVEIGTRPQTGMIQVDDNPVTIGAEENGAESRVVESEFNGLIDEVRIYNRVLSPQEIQALFQQPPD